MIIIISLTSFWATPLTRQCIASNVIKNRTEVKVHGIFGRLMTTKWILGRKIFVHFGCCNMSDFRFFFFFFNLSL